LSDKQLLHFLPWSCLPLLDTYFIQKFSDA
jgi:hypothetical protein